MRLNSNRNNNNSNNINRNNVPQEGEKVKPLLKIKPKFNLLVLASNYFVTLATLIFIAVLLVQASAIKILPCVAIIGVYLLYVAIRILINKSHYNKTVYLFFETELLILKKYGKQEQIIIPYEDIADILFYQNYAEKIFGMGKLGIKIRSGNFLNNIIMLEGIDDLNGTIEKLKYILYG